MNNLYQIFRKVKQIENNLLNVAYIEKEYNEKYRKKVKVALFVSKKQIIKSFKRNRIKRLMRMSYQLNKKIITLKKQKRYYLLFRYIKKKMF
ncbi:ribonuclease P protein component [Candidatus Karelsulcia muelleri]|uniref:ribonuclease P protein component n=1 Tax=Candidatus Karelsulcia muelleri TaxID=336810 RepID=UPI002363FFE0|nr:ribonuclease P protein component [Candidatus Karelsulcia muelleri]WDE42218.1 ribonuclease P protein component [Candidatus Karelsulcia muelleri]